MHINNNRKFLQIHMKESILTNTIIGNNDKRVWVITALQQLYEKPASAVLIGERN